MREKKSQDSLNLFVHQVSQREKRLQKFLKEKEKRHRDKIDKNMMVKGQVVANVNGNKMDRREF